MEPRPSSLEILVVNPAFWNNKRVFLTGHTGFKGGWLSFWLQELGAQVHGFALEPPTSPSVFEVLGLESKIASHTIGDICNLDVLAGAMQQSQPDVVLHLAAQPLVLRSYQEPVETFAVNVQGTVHVLEAARRCSSVKAMVNVTTDKCYHNREWVWPYREDEPMGGSDPYSSSKACSEIVTAAYRQSFFAKAGIGLGSARAGNVIGGGDWAENRLIPDFLRAIGRGEPIVIRSPNATRPWQHVLEPLAGYLTLAEHLAASPEKFSDGWNFGPDDVDAKPVRWIVDHLCEMVDGASWELDEQAHAHEAGCLKLDSSKAKNQLDWHPRWNLGTALKQTLRWHQAWQAGDDLCEVTRQQIQAYQRGEV